MTGVWRRLRTRIAVARCGTCRAWRRGIGHAERLGNHRHADGARDRYLDHRRRVHQYRTPQLQEHT